MLSWILLVVAGFFEVAWAIGLKYTEGLSRPLPTVLTVAAMVISMGSLGIVARQLPIGTAYAVWTGIGVFGTAVLGMYLFGESMAPLRLVCLGLIITGIVGLKLTAA
ncbi:MAG TPA: quaternary ammonium compound efflux SMR transporter SugE [Gammaproteobacteria bacterium]|nr:quaternary ammonium compound efflux SMR transporter SugE [Gammaproteobacteria bacterium]